jgi:hypothetical protein
MRFKSRHAAVRLDLQLELWRVLTETLKKWGEPYRKADDSGLCAGQTHLFKGPGRNDPVEEMCYEDDSHSPFPLDQRRSPTTDCTSARKLSPTERG